MGKDKKSGFIVNEGEPSLRAVSDFMNQTKELRKSKATDEFSNLNVPISIDFLHQLSILGPKESLEILRKHPGCEQDERIESLKLALKIYNACCTDLNQSVSLFSSRVKDINFEVDNESSEHDMINIKVQKDLYSVCNSAKMLINICRKVNNVFNIEGYTEKVNEYFLNTKLHYFIIEFRNILSHSLIIKANWTVHLSFGEKPADALYYIYKSELMKFYDQFNLNAKAYIDSIKDKVDICSIANSYSMSVNKFYRWYFSEIEGNLPQKVKDYRRCIAYINSNSSIMSYNLMIKTWIDRNVNPYRHLHRLLTRKQLCEIYKYPNNSKEQVDRIISFLDVHDIASGEFRNSIYELFNVIGI